MKRLRLAMGRSRMQWFIRRLPDELLAAVLFLALSVFFAFAALFPVAARSLCAVLGAGSSFAVLRILYGAALDLADAYREDAKDERKRLAEDVMES